MGKYVIRTFLTEYGPWEEGADEPPRIGEPDEETHEFDTLEEVRAHLDGEGLNSPSQSPGAGPTTWLSLLDGSRPTWDGNYTGHTEELTAHRVEGFTDEEWASLVEDLRAPGH
ncbi:hypothetical protein [Saccharothrix sp. HUAS TT1]|uniref:hypothetical protein n=1 Tax=unclassified Saccharothrix TaxID=2593673 RepID=UPI00345C3605